jgi:hypothetical protein
METENGTYVPIDMCKLIMSFAADAGSHRKGSSIKNIIKFVCASRSVYSEWTRDARFRTDVVLASHAGDVEIAIAALIRHDRCIDVDVLRSLCALVQSDDFDTIFRCTISIFNAFMLEIVKRGDDAVAYRVILDAAVDRIRPEMHTLFFMFAFGMAITHKRLAITHMIKNTDHADIQPRIAVNEMFLFMETMRRDDIDLFIWMSRELGTGLPKLNELESCYEEYGARKIRDDSAPGCTYTRDHT